MSAPRDEAPRPGAVIFGCAGPTLSEDERQFFEEANPLGFILFARNCVDPGQVRRLISALRNSVGRAAAPVLIDQEGGRVARLGPPHWRAPPAAARFGEMALVDRDRAVEAARLNAHLIAAELFVLGITFDCAPVLDVGRPETHTIIGDRAFAGRADLTALLGWACRQGLLDGGAMPIMKHIPGHGRATVDSHEALPTVEAPVDELEAVDFAPFLALNDTPWAMTAHVVYRAVDAVAPATTSPIVIAEVIRGLIGFEGVLISDDISMKALTGTVGERTEAALAAGCDVVLHCNGKRDEMEAVAAAAGVLGDAALARLHRGEGRWRSPTPINWGEAAARLDELMGEGVAP